MVYVYLRGLEKGTGIMLNKIDAWVLGAEQEMKKWIENSGYTLVEEEITLMGDMILWVD